MNRVVIIEVRSNEYMVPSLRTEATYKGDLPAILSEIYRSVNQSFKVVVRKLSGAIYRGECQGDSGIVTMSFDVVEVP